MTFFSSLHFGDSRLPVPTFHVVAAAVVLLHGWGMKIFRIFIMGYEIFSRKLVGV